MAIFFHIHDNIACKYICNIDCAEYDGTCSNCIEIKSGANKGKYACVHIKGHISANDVTHLMEEISQAYL